ncbi:MAG TPA: hypothetical protein VIF62_13915 [Labilithrix sp.]|jgi:hypothetical protein
MSKFAGRVGVVCVAFFVTADAGAEQPVAGAQTARPGTTNPVATPTGVIISQVETTTDVVDNSVVNVTMANWDNVERDVVLNTDPKLGSLTTHNVKVKAHGQATVSMTMLGGNVVNGKVVGGNGTELCAGTFAINLSLSGANADTKPRKATHPVPVFEAVKFNYGSVGAPPFDPNVANHAVKLHSVAVEGGYACGKKLKLQVGVKNGSGITPAHLSARVFDAPLAGAPAFVIGNTNGGPNNGGAIIADGPIAIGGTETKDFVLVSSSNVSGTVGTISVELVDSTTELGSHLGYWRWASFVVREAKTMWKLE